MRRIFFNIQNVEKSVENVECFPAENYAKKLDIKVKLLYTLNIMDAF